MKPVVQLKEIPEELAGNRVAVWNEKKDSQTIAYVYENDVLTHVSIAENDRWDTFKVEDSKWGKATVDYLEGWSCAKENEVTFETVRQIQRRVKTVQWQKRQAKKYNETDRLMNQARPYTKDFEKWAKNHMKKRMIFRVDDRHTGFCTCCGKTVTTEEELKHKYKTTCPNCGKRVEVCTTKKLPKSENWTFALFQKIKNGVMCRYVNLHRSFNSFHYGEPDDWKNADGFSEELRVVLEAGGRQWWYEKRDWWLPGAEWKKNNCRKWVKTRNWPGSYGYYERNSRSHSVPVFEKSLKEIVQHTPLRYVNMHMVSEYERYSTLAEKSYAVMDVLESLQKSPQIESLYKIGLEDLALDLIEKRYIAKGRELHRFLGISKELFRQVRSGALSCTSRQQLLMLKRYEGVTHDMDLVAQMQRKNIDRGILDTLFQMADLPVRKTMRYIQEQPAWMYADYIRMASNLGYDLSDDFVRYPRNLEEAHDAAIEVREERREAEELKKAAEKDKSVRLKMKKVKKKMTMEIGNYVVRPAMSNTELVREGQQLHHCVGNGIYRDRILDGTSYILFLRRKDEPEKAYYTLEVEPSGKVRQAFGIRDSKPDWGVVGPVVKQIGKEVGRRWKASSKKKKNVTSAETVA